MSASFATDDIAGWCLSAARCCSLRLELRSRGGSPAPCVMTNAGAHLTPGARALAGGGPVAVSLSDSSAAAVSVLTDDG